MDKYVAEVSFGNKFDLPDAIAGYNAKANKFQSGLNEIELKYKSFLADNKVSLGVQTIDNIENCTIKLKALPGYLVNEIQNDIIELFNTTWSQ